jgi:hypothetical protein
MIINEFYNGQGLGNQLWNYAVLRILAKKNSCDFSVIGEKRFKGSEFMDIDFGKETLGGMTIDGGPAYKLPNGIKNYFREQKEYLNGTTIDISRTDPRLLELKDSTKFDGNCQSIKYLEGMRNDLLSWIKIKEEFKKHKTGDNVCVVHLRGGDFKKIKGVFLPQNYYLKAMEYIKSKNQNVTFSCVTDDVAFAKEFLPSDVEIIGSALEERNDNLKAGHHIGGPIGIDFSILMQAKYLIIPNSSFSWWAAYLNKDSEIIVAPKYWAAFNNSNGYWSTSDIITEGFTYLDKTGNFFTPEECVIEKDIFESKNHEIFMPQISNQEKLATFGEFINSKFKDSILYTKMKIKRLIKK